MVALTRIKNNQITDSTVNAAAKLQDYSVTAGKLANNITYGSDLTVSGNLTVNGQTTTIDTNVTTIEDPVILLASTQTGSPAVDIGFIGERGTSDNIAFVWDESADEFVTAFTSTGETNTTITISSYASFKTLDAAVTGNLAVTGTTGLTGNLTLGNLSVGSSKTLIFGDNVLANVGTPTLDNDAATKAYVDGAVSSSGFTVTDGVSNATIEGGDTIEFTGTASEITVTQSGNAAYAIFTFGLPNDVTISGNLISNKIDANTTITATGNVSGGNITTAGVVNATGNVTGGNVTTGGQVVATANVTGGNITTGGVVDATGTITGGNLSTAGTVTATGNVTGGNLLTGGLINATGTITATGNVSGGNVTTGGVVNATGNVTGGNLSTAGTVTATGNVTGGNVTTGGVVNATGNVTGGNINTAGQVVATGNVTGGNLITSGLASVTGNVIGGNIVTVGLTNTGTLQVSGNAIVDGNLTVNGNLTYINIDDLRVQDPIIILGTGPNGAPLTTNDGLDRGVFMEYYTSGLGNAFMGWDNSTGNMVIAASAYFTANDVVGVNSYGTLQAGNLYVQSTVSTGNITGGNLITAGQVVATANVTGGNINTAGQVVATGNITGGNLITAGTFESASISATGNITGGNINTAGQVVATGNVTGGNINTAGVVDATGNLQTGANIVATGYASITGNVTGGNLITAGLASVTGNVTGGNINTAGQVVATGNVTGGNINTAGQVVATGNLQTGANIVATGYASITGNVTGGNLITAGLASITGNVTGGNLITAGLASVTGNVTGGNINTAGQVVATGNVTGGNVIATALVTGANVTATSNVSGANVVGTTAVIGGNIVISGDDITDTNGRVNFNTAGADVDFAVNGDTVANVFYVDAGTGTVSFGSATQTTGAIAAFNTTNSVLMPVGNIGTRPVTGVTGMMRFNTTNNNLEVYDNSQWSAVGVPSFTVIVNDQFNGDDVTVAFTLSESASTDSVIVSINGVVQIPTTAYSVSGTTLTFTEAPQTGDTIDARILTTTTSVTSISNTSGNAVVATLDTDKTVQITGDLLPASNLTANLGSPTKYWKSLYVGGNTIYLGNLQLKNDNGTMAFYEADGTTPAPISSGSVDTSLISSGTSSVAVIAAGGNVRTNIAGATVQTISSTGVEITGNLSVTGNATLSGNILGDRVQNGTTSFDIQTLNGNANITVAGTSNVAVFSTAGANITGALGVTGNITGSYIFGNGSQLTGIDATSIQNGTANVRTFLNGNVAISAAGTANVVLIQSTGANITGTLGVTGNITGGNVTTTGVFAGSGAQLTNIPAANVTGTLSVNTTGYAATVSTAAQPNITSVGTLSSLSVTANVTAGNLSVGTGTITGGNIVNSNANGVGNIGSSTTYFNTVFAKATSAQYADLAEKYVADAEYPAGTVVIFGGEKEVTVTSVDADRAVAGVVSTNPSYIMNGGLEAEFVATVALTGRVPCRVTGTVKKGDLMVSAGYGLARAEQDPKVGTVIGKALENFEGNEGVIEVVVGRF